MIIKFGFLPLFVCPPAHPVTYPITDFLYLFLCFSKLFNIPDYHVLVILIIKCPMGYAPKKTTYYPKTGMCRALFKKNCCDNCPHKDKCQPKSQKKNYAVHVSKSMADRAAYLRLLGTETYTKYSHLRNAVEGIPSVLRRRYRVDDLPVFGLTLIPRFKKNIVI